MTEKLYYSWNHNDLLLELKIQTKASRNAIIGVYNGHLKIAITTAPTDGKANEHLTKFLANHFGVPQNQITIIKGHQNKHKSVLISSPKKNMDDFQ
ncbi:MAG: YggU family protein [Gammaproteobacteria bacterium]|nr:YggU family protein [Gammaproteobacteria bacterium]